MLKNVGLSFLPGELIYLFKNYQFVLNIKLKEK